MSTMSTGTLSLSLYAAAAASPLLASPASMPTALLLFLLSAANRVHGSGDDASISGVPTAEVRLEMPLKPLAAALQYC